MPTHQPPSPHRRRLLQAGTAAIALAAGAGAFAQTAAKQTLRVGFQKGGGLLGVLKVQGSLEKALAPQGWAVTWHEFPAGPQLLEALNAGSVDIGYTGAPPPIFAQAAGIGLVYIGAEPTGPSIEGIVALPDSPLRNAADLRGKRVAVQKGSSANFLLVAALEKAGLKLSDVQPIYLPPADARAAFESRRVDAWAIWDPYLAAIQQAAQARVLADYSNGLLRPNAFYEASRSFVDAHPKTVAAVLEVLTKTGTWASANPRAVAELLAPQLGLPVEVVETWQRRTRYGVQPLSDALIAVQQQVADTFFAQQLIPKKIDVAAAVWRWDRG